MFMIISFLRDKNPVYVIDKLIILLQFLKRSTDYVSNRYFSLFSLLSPFIDHPSNFCIGRFSCVFSVIFQFSSSARLWANLYLMPVMAVVYLFASISFLYFSGYRICCVCCLLLLSNPARPKRSECHIYRLFYIWTVANDILIIPNDIRKTESVVTAVTAGRTERKPANLAVSFWSFCYLWLGWLVQSLFCTIFA